MNAPFQKDYTQNTTVTVGSEVVACPDISKPALFEHPRVYLRMKNNRATCPYCGIQFIYKREHSE